MKRILIDANLLCVLVAGLHAPAALGRHKRLKAYSAEDFQLILQMIAPFDKVLTCPHILTETSNLLSTTNDTEKAALLEGLRLLLNEMEEIRAPSIFACDQKAYKRLGLTDAVILTLELSGAPLFTADLDLALAAESGGRLVINFNHYRSGSY